MSGFRNAGPQVVTVALIAAVTGYVLGVTREQRESVAIAQPVQTQSDANSDRSAAAKKAKPRNTPTGKIDDPNAIKIPTNTM